VTVGCRKCGDGVRIGTYGHYKEEVLECDTQREVKEMWWGVLEKEQRLQDNIQCYGDCKYTSLSYLKTEGSYKYDCKLLKQYQAPVYAGPFIYGTIGNAIVLIIIICNKDM
jgi:hypothetical protein